LEELNPQPAMEDLAVFIVERKLSTPAIFLLEAAKPLSLVGNQLLIFFQPLVGLFATLKDYPSWIKILEDRENLEKLIRLIEEKETSISKKPAGDKNG